VIAPIGYGIFRSPILRQIPSSHASFFAPEELEDLMASIRAHGILQPITVTEKSDGGYELIAGERRYRAAQAIGLPTVPALVRKTTPTEKLELALIENIQRQNLNAIEEAIAYNRLITEFGLTQEEVAVKVGKQRSTVANTLRLLDLPEVIQQALMTGTISPGKAKALLSLKDQDEQLRVFHDMTGTKMNVRAVEQLVAAHSATERKGIVRKNPNIRAQEELIEERLGTKVHITERGQKGTIVIEYYSHEELKRLIEELT
jgi:ParB family chromosome partitioning protein